MSDSTIIPVTPAKDARYRVVNHHDTPETLPMPDPTPGMTLERLVSEVEAARPVVVRRVVSRYRDIEMGDSIAQQCVIDAWTKWTHDPAYFLAHDLLAWTTQRAYWRVRDRLDERARFAPLAEEHAADEGEARVKTPESYAVAREPDVEREQVWALVHECLAELPDADHALIDQHWFEGLTDKAIGDRLFGTDDGTAQARGLRVFRRRDKVQERLKELVRARGYDPMTGQAP